MLPLVLLAVMLAVVCARGDARAGEVSEHEIRIGTETRSYLMMKPDGASGPRPLVIALHGAGQTAEGFRRYFGLDETAQANDFVAVYPQGEGRVWDDGRPAGLRLKAMLRPGDDVPFLLTLAQKLVQEGVADPARLYIAGISMGGFMAERMACEYAHVFAAYTAIMATAPANYREDCHPARPVPIMFIHGTADSVIGYGGFWTPVGATLSAPDSAALFARLNGCGAPVRRDLPNLDRWDGTSVWEDLWANCRDGVSVRFLTIERGGHQSPARVETDSSLAASILGLRNRDVDAGTEAWRFMSAYALPSASPPRAAVGRERKPAQSKPAQKPENRSARGNAAPADSAKPKPAPVVPQPGEDEQWPEGQSPASALATGQEKGPEADRPATSLW